MSNLFISKADCTCVIWCRIEILTVVYICEPVTSNPSILWTLALHKLFVSQPVHMPSARGASTQVNLLQEYAFDINFPVILHFLNLVYLIDLSTKLSKASVSHISRFSSKWVLSSRNWAGAGQKVHLQNVCHLSARLFSLGYSSCLAALLASAGVDFGIRDVVYQLL